MRVLIKKRMIKCSKCGKEGVTAWQPHSCQAAPDRPRSNARSRMANTHKAHTRGKPASDTAPSEVVPSAPISTADPDKPDTAPLDPRSMSDDQLRPFFNEWMRRKMASRYLNKKLNKTS